MQAITVVILLFGVVVSLDGKRFRCDYKYFKNAEGWLKLHKIPANWHEARLRCHLEGSKLASPLNVGIKSAMKTLMEQDHIVKRGVFTGIHATFSRGDFFSVEVKQADGLSDRKKYEQADESPGVKKKPLPIDTNGCGALPTLTEMFSHLGVPLQKIPHKWATGEPNNFNDTESCILKTPEGDLADVNCDDTFPYMCYKKASEVKHVTGCGTVDTDYTLDSRTGSCYKFHRVPRTWSRAYMVCASEGGYLTIINSDTEAQVIREIFGKNPGGVMLGNFDKDIVFVGFHDWNEHGEWLTIEGQTLQEAGYAKFDGGEPNNMTTGQFCGSVFRNALSNDLFCENKYAFICEMSPDSLLCDNDD